MLSHTLAGCLIATTLLAGPAFAQEASSPSANPAMNAAPGAAQPGAGTSAAAGGTVPGPAGVAFFTNTAGSADWRGSKFMGVDIRGTNNEKIGDVKDLILDHTGMIQAVVIGVGGFLGLGEKDVAVPFKTVEWVQQPDRTAGATTGTMNETGAAPSTGSAMNSTGSTNGKAMGNGTTDVTGTVNSAAMARAYPDHGRLRMTKDELKNAPTYRYPDDTRAPAP